MSEASDDAFERLWREDTGFFGPGSMMWKVMRSRLLGLAGSRALIMQLAMPDVAQGVLRHSDFMKNPLGRARRTFQKLVKIIFGTKQEAYAALREVGGKHARVVGVLDADTSALRTGQPYSARDDETKLWVLACFADTVFDMHNRLFPPLTADELELFWADWRVFGELFRVPAEIMPRTWADFRRYVDDKVEGRATLQPLEPRMPTVRKLSRRLFRNWLAILLFSGVTTWGLLPEPLRHLALVTPPILQELRHKMAMAIIRFLARLGTRHRFEPDYIGALSRVSATHAGLEPWEARLARDVQQRASQSA